MDFNWRDCQAWKQQGLSISTVSNDAAKYFDITLSQLVSWKEDDQFGGLEGSIEKLINADPSFALGRCLKYGIELIGASGAIGSDQYANEIADLIKLAKKSNLNNRELYHVEAIRCLQEGNLDLACNYWEDILVENPTDLMALKFAHDVYFYMGLKDQMRDSVSRVLPLWNSSLPLYSYLHGMHAFGLVQSNFFEKAKSSALKSLELNKSDAWATHALCHYNEYVNDYNGGIKFLKDTEKDWSGCGLISPHNYWHLCLYHLEKDDHESAIEIFDNHIYSNLKLNRTLDLIDIASFLFRLKLDGCKIDLSERWKGLIEVCNARITDHGYVFNDLHVLMGLSECNQDSQPFFNSFENYLSQKVASHTDEQFLDKYNNVVNRQNPSINFLTQINKTLAKPLFDAICHYDQGEYSKVVDCLYPIRYDIHKIGGSNAQRDIFHQLLTQSALRSESEYHNKIGLALINERLAIKPNSNLTKE